MTKSATVLGIEADGIRGIKLAFSKGECKVADRCFWRTAAEQSEQQADASAQEGDEPAVSAEDARFDRMVEAFKEAARRFGTREVVLAVPASSMLLQMTQVPVEERDRLDEIAVEEIGKVSPFSDPSPVAGVETVSETDRDITSISAVLPESEAAEAGDALFEAKVRVLRTDVTALGWLRTRWADVFPDGGDASSRKVVLMDCDGAWDLVVIDGQAPSLLRGLGASSSPEDVRREVMLSLIRAGTATETSEIVVLAKGKVDEAFSAKLSSVAPVRIVSVCGEAAEEDDPDTLYGGVEGVALRTFEGSALDATPADWAEARTEARFQKKLYTFAGIAAAGWLLATGTLFGGPFVYGMLADREKAESKRHAAAYREVKDMRDKVKLVRQYSDHARGALELLKAVSDRLPSGVTLTSFNHRRGERLSIAGEAELPTKVYDFKNALTEATVGEDAKLFAEVNLQGPSQSRGVHRFSIECLYESAEEK